MEGIIRVKSPSDPLRCQAVNVGSTATNKEGQCWNQAVEGKKFCPMHGGNSKPKTSVMMSNYRLAQWQSRVDELANSSGVKSLRDEIGVLRMTLEAVVTKCQDQTDLILYSPRIADMVTRIEKLVVSCNKLETAAGMMLDKSAAIILAGKMVEIIGQHVTDPNAVESIAGQIGELITDITKTGLESI